MSPTGFDISAETGARLRETLAAFCREADVRHAALLQDSGVVLCQHGDAAFHDAGETAAVATGAFFAARQLARRLGEPEFAGLHYEGTERHFLMAPVTDDSLLLVVFGNETRLAVVRACTRHTLPRLADELATLSAFAAPPVAPEPALPGARASAPWAQETESLARLWMA